MQFLFGIALVWFVMGSALMIRDQKAGHYERLRAYLTWPREVFRRWA